MQVIVSREKSFIFDQYGWSRV